MCNNLLISVEGNIGSGKSTLLNQLIKAYSSGNHHEAPINLLLEPVEEWTKPMEVLGEQSMLESFYTKTHANSFAFQMFVLKTRVDQLMQVAEGGIVISERCMLSHDKIFAHLSRQRGDIDDIQWVTYHGWVDTIQRLSGEFYPSGVVYLRTSPQTCQDRMISRKRDCETSLTLDFLVDLHEEHERFIQHLINVGVHVLVLDGDVHRVDGMTDSDMVRSIQEFVDELLQEKSKLE